MASLAALPFFLFFSLLFISVNAISASNYTQALDHFGHDKSTFQQQYLISDTDWGGAGNRTPILVFLGGESPISSYVSQIGLINEAAPRLQALVVYIEHRYYGASIPYGSIDAALGSPKVRSFLTTKQALADFASIITSLKTNLSAINSPVIVIGASYSGVLAAWFRIKYPHIAIGAVASSAPILFREGFPPESDFCSIMSRDFQSANTKCSDIIRQSWNVIDQIASCTGGLEFLTELFHLCSPLLSSRELKKFLAHIYSFAAQYNGRHNHWISFVCNSIVGASNSNTGLDGIAMAVVAIGGGNRSCVPLKFNRIISPFPQRNVDAVSAWDWQLCSEIVIQKSCAKNNSLLIPNEAIDDHSEQIENCRKAYGPLARAGSLPTYYGRQDIIKSASNIIFSNGLMDPYSSLGILDDLSDTIRAINTEQGSHCLDTNSVQEDDPKWLVRQRKKEIEILKKWIKSGGPKIAFAEKAVCVIYVFTILFVRHLV
ncbi:hypothetical protein Cgig2_013303 [Carnegiea gigantea]|uniref:Uncharacterized protein n=1 Tax=Carnegiea gigantea TaxID=171969 RepID=A0A9Q1JF36_9CARY|nr:hypothetical protein Cgig2_013303 [Carnegiea gigantea]